MGTINSFNLFFFRVHLDRIRPIKSEYSKVSSGAVNNALKTNNGWNAVGRYGGYASGVLMAYGAYNSYENISNSDNTGLAISKEVGGWAGALGGGYMGAEIGAVVGAWFGGVGAIPGAFIGGIIGSGVGYFSGSQAGELLYNKL